ncbi:hypothetical protein BH24ACT3_BH24ACT3_07830 [soil metagenome]
MTEDRRVLITRLLLLLMAVSSAVVGAWAQFAPRSFYDDFPGGGRTWVAVDGPYNEHLVRDVGGLNLGLLLVTVIALVTLARPVVAAAAGAALVYGVPHLAYHATHLEPYGTGDKVANVIALALAITLPALVLVLVGLNRQSPPSGAR